MKNEKSPYQSPTQEIESRVNSLCQGIENRDPLSLQRIRKRIPGLADASVQELTREQARLAIARELGFKDWQMAADVFAARLNPGDDYGEFWYVTATAVLLNLWCRNYEEALRLHQDQGGYLLPYKRQFVVVQKTYIEILKMNPHDAAWESVKYNLAKPADIHGFGQLVLSRLKQIGE